MVASRGDRIRCTVMFEEEIEREDGKKQVPICFTLNGRRILIKRTKQHRETDRVFMDYHDDKPLYPYIGMTEGCSVLAKVSISEKGLMCILMKPPLSSRSSTKPRGSKIRACPDSDLGELIF